MTFEEFEKTISDQIGVYSTVSYGSVGICYLNVLICPDGKIVSIGEIHYNIFREGYATRELLVRFGKECEDFRLGFRTVEPSCYFESGTIKIS